MSENEPKRHHYIPKLVLSEFSDKHGRLWCNQQGSTRVFPVSKENVFV